MYVHSPFRLKQMFRLSPSEARTLLVSSVLCVFLVLLVAHTEVPELLRLSDNSSNDAVSPVTKTPQPPADIAIGCARHIPSTVLHSLRARFVPIERASTPLSADILALCSILRR